MAHWGYTGEAGPENWHKEFPIAHGKRQSPVDIKTSDVQYDASLGHLKFDYDPKSISNVCNNGHTFTVSVGQTDVNDLTGGPLTDKYELAQFHCHWGSTDEVGSEHTVNGKHYSSELHFVHWNTDKFKTIGDAIKADRGIAVLGTFITVGKEDHPGWNTLIPYLEKIIHKDEKTDINIPGGFHAKDILPTNTDEYYTYEGSLTTPPLYESVSWIVFKKPIEISQDQMNRFRALRSSKSGDQTQSCMSDNYRPTMELKGRVIRSSFLYKKPSDGDGVASCD